jgi:transcriptional regulator with XRE-family HTH domain
MEPNSELLAESSTSNSSANFSASGHPSGHVSGHVSGHPSSPSVEMAVNNDNELVERRKKFGAWLRDCRRSARITQAELAKALSYDSSQLISNIERGVSLLPSRRLPDFARVLGCSLLEMEVRYFQCSAKNTSESRMPDLLLKYLPVIEVLEYGKAVDDEVLAAIKKTRG